MSVMTRNKKPAPPPTADSPAQAVRQRLARLTEELARLNSEIRAVDADVRTSRHAAEQAALGEVTGANDAQAVTTAQAALARAESTRAGLLDRRTLLAKGQAQLAAQQADVEIKDLVQQMHDMIPTFRADLQRLGQALDAAAAIFHEAQPVAGRLAQLAAEHDMRVMKLEPTRRVTAPADAAALEAILGWADLFTDAGAHIAGERALNHAEQSRLGQWRATCRERGFEA